MSLFYKIFSCFYSSNKTTNKLELNEKPNPLDVTWENTIQFIPPISEGLVIKVYDGDTITIASKLPYADSPTYRFSVRLNGIDCPEIKSKNENEKLCAKIAKNYVEELLLHKNIVLKNVTTEKYGRLLADVYLNDLCINNELLSKKLAVSYDGGTKKSPDNWLVYHNS
jgi:endonuclease YncB( thermonuclease family)